MSKARYRAGFLAALTLAAAPVQAGSCPGQVRYAAAPFRCAGANTGTPCHGPGDAVCGAGTCQTASGGRATFYDFAAGGGGNACDLPVASPATAMIAAANEQDFAASAVCGRCVQVTGELGTIVVPVVDLCPASSGWCGERGHLDLSMPAFAAIANPAYGVVPITWVTVPCPVAGALGFQWHTDSNLWWQALQVRNHRHGVARVEVASSANPGWHDLPRLTWNRFLFESPNGNGDPGPFDIRVTDVFGGQVTSAGVGYAPGLATSGSGQLADGPGPLWCDGVETGALVDWNGRAP